MKDVRKVVFPVAGLGTRFLPATKAMPKEMLPVVDKPLIQYAVEEAYAAGITDMIFITGRYKRAIEDHFDKAPMLEKELIEKGKTELLQTVRSIAPMGVTFIYIRQPEPLGLGHAVLCAQPVVGDEPFAVMLADDLIDAQQSAIGQLIEARKQLGGGNILAVQDVPKADTKKYGIVGVEDSLATTSLVHEMVEKPDPDHAPSTLAVIGRYVLEPEIFERLKKVQKGVGGEIQLTDAIASQLDLGTTYSHRFDGIRYDCGSKQGFLDATVRFARKVLRESDMPSILRDKEDFTAKDVYDAAKAGDTAAAHVIRRVTGYLGQALAGIAAVVDPEIIVVGGGVSKAGGFLIRQTAEKFRACAFNQQKHIPIVLASLGNEAGVIGASRMIMNQCGEDTAP